MVLPSEPQEYKDSEGMKRTLEFYKGEIAEEYTWRTNCQEKDAQEYKDR